MRQINPVTNLVMSVLAGVGLLASLALPWFAAPVTDPTGTDGPVERAAFQVSQVFATHAKGTISGSDALGGGQTALVGLVALVALVGFCVTMPPLRRQAETLLHLIVLATPVVFVVVAATHSGTQAPVRIHYGMLVGLAAMLWMMSAAWQVARMRERRKVTGTVRISSS